MFRECHFCPQAASDPAGTTYGLSYTAAVGDFWSVTSSAAMTSVKIDATTGMIVP